MEHPPELIASDPPTPPPPPPPAAVCIESLVPLQVDPDHVVFAEGDVVLFNSPPTPSAARGVVVKVWRARIRRGYGTTPDRFGDYMAVVFIRPPTEGLAVRNPDFPLPHRTVWLQGQNLRHATADDNEVNQHFPLKRLPMPCLARVLRWLPLADSAIQCLTCRRFHLAWSDEASWRIRFMDELRGIDPSFSESEVERRQRDFMKCSWLAFYRSFSPWKIHIYTISQSRIQQRQLLVVSPFWTVGHLMSLSSHAVLRPFEPAMLVVEKWDSYAGQYEALSGLGTPNCRFESSDMNALLFEVGLCHNAVLESIDDEPWVLNEE